MISVLHLKAKMKWQYSYNAQLANDPFNLTGSTGSVGATTFFCFCIPQMPGLERTICILPFTSCNCICVPHCSTLFYLFILFLY